MVHGAITTTERPRLAVSDDDDDDDDDEVDVLSHEET